MSRLTNQIRQSMLSTVLDHAFSEKQNQAKAELIAAGDALYMDRHGEHLKPCRNCQLVFFTRRATWIPTLVVSVIL